METTIRHTINDLRRENDKQQLADFLTSVETVPVPLQFISNIGNRLISTEMATVGLFADLS